MSPMCKTFRLAIFCTVVCTVCAINQPRIPLNTGQMMPYVNLGGTSQAVRPGNHFSNYSEFLRQGGRGLDTALSYTDPVNIQIGKAIKAHPELKREEIFVTSKVPCCNSKGKSRGGDACTKYPGSMADHLKYNAKLLQLEYVDLTLLHWPCNTMDDSIKRYLELQDALSTGLTKAIGVSNFGYKDLQQLLNDTRVKVVPAANQCNHAIANHNESHNRFGGDDMTVKFCKEHNISYSAYSPLEGLDGQDVFNLPQVKAIAKAHNVSGAQVALKWLVQQGITVVTAAHNPEYIHEDIDLWSFELTAKEMAELAAI